MINYMNIKKIFLIEAFFSVMFSLLKANSDLEDVKIEGNTVIYTWGE